jgi:hypothetical protein
MGHSMYRSETDGLDEETGFCGGRFELAERVGFEPTLEFPLNTLSKRAPSATRPSLLHTRNLPNLSENSSSSLAYSHGPGLLLITCFCQNQSRNIS